MKNILQLEFQLTKTPIAFCYGEKAYTKYIKKRFGIVDDLQMDGRATEIYNDAEYNIVIGVHKSSGREFEALLIHELSHAVSMLIDRFEFGCDELRSYTLQWLTQECLLWLDTVKE